jgi:hypothetical protein
MHLNPEITVGNLLTLVGMFIGFISLYLSISTRLTVIETWMKQHEKLDDDRFAGLSRRVDRITWPPHSHVGETD